MVKTSTLFYFYDELNNVNELYDLKELTEPGDLFNKELMEIFGRIDLCPRPEVLKRILNEI